MNVCKWSRSTSTSQSPVNDVSRRTNWSNPCHVNTPHIIMESPPTGPMPCFQLGTISSWGLRYSRALLSTWNNWNRDSSDYATRFRPSSVQLAMLRSQGPVCGIVALTGTFRCVSFTPINLWNLKNTQLTRWICACIECNVNKYHLWPWSLRTHGRPLHCPRWSLHRVFPVCI